MLLEMLKSFPWPMKQTAEESAKRNLATQKARPCQPFQKAASVNTERPSAKKAVFSPHNISKFVRSVSRTVCAPGISCPAGRGIIKNYFPPTVPCSPPSLSLSPQHVGCFSISRKTLPEQCVPYGKFKTLKVFLSRPKLTFPQSRFYFSNTKHYDLRMSLVQTSWTTFIYTLTA